MTNSENSPIGKDHTHLYRDLAPRSPDDSVIRNPSNASRYHGLHAMAKRPAKVHPVEKDPQEIIRSLCCG